MKQLIEIQAIRHAREAKEKAEAKAQLAQALEEARLHIQPAELEGVPCDVAVDFPDPNGFVFSTAEIARAIRTVSHPEAARRAESYDWTAVRHPEQHPQCPRASPHDT